MYSLWQDLSCFSSCRYQPPLPADQVKPLNEYEEEGGKLIVLSLIFFKRVKSCDFHGMCSCNCNFDTQKARQGCEEGGVAVEGAGVEVEVLLSTLFCLFNCDCMT
jgi:hypothetical protein